MRQGQAVACNRVQSAATTPYSLYKHDEWERYSVEITEWEVQEYLRFF